MWLSRSLLSRLCCVCVWRVQSEIKGSRQWLNAYKGRLVESQRHCYIDFYTKKKHFFLSFFSFSFFSLLPSLLSFVRNIVNAIKPSYPFVCVTRCGSCVYSVAAYRSTECHSTEYTYGISVRWLRTHTHTPYFLLYNFTKVGRERKRGEGGEGEREREKKKDISHYKILSYMYIIGENTRLYKLVHRNPHPTPFLLHSYIPIGASHFATPRAHTHTSHTLSRSRGSL